MLSQNFYVPEQRQRFHTAKTQSGREGMWDASLARRRPNEAGRYVTDRG